MDRSEAQAQAKLETTITCGTVQRALLVAASVGALFVMTGCQVTTECGVWRSWADVNSLGGPAAIVAQMRTDNFRTAAPPSVLHDARLTDIPRSVAKPDFQEFDVIPMVAPTSEMQQTSHVTLETEVSGTRRGTTTPEPSKPAGAWLF